MKLLRNFNLFIAFFILLASSTINARSQWDVAALFLGKNEDAIYQKDVDDNLRELKKIKSTEINLKIFIESEQSNTKSINLFLKKSFQNLKNKKLLIVYSHGLGAEGLKDYNSLLFKEEILKGLPKLDLIWLDSCFMSNIEFLYNIRNQSFYTIASEDAEFSSGMPFESLNELPNFSDNLLAANFLSKSFIHSYSYIEKGSQRLNAKESSATISVINNQELEKLVRNLKVAKQIFNTLSDSEKNQITKTMNKNYSMDKKDLVDLGQLLIQIRAKNKSQKNDLILTELIRSLNISSIKSLKSNPRIKIESPEDKAVLVFGFNNWREGNRADFEETNSRFMKFIKPDGYIKGSNQEQWPYIILNSNSKTLTPFLPGIDEFNYFILSHNLKTKLMQNKSIKRDIDLFEKESAESSKLIQYFGYTQKIGKLAEKYTGINITNLSEVPSIDYFESEFNQITNWLSL